MLIGIEYILNVIRQNYNITPETIKLHKRGASLVYIIEDKCDKYIFKVYLTSIFKNIANGEAFRTLETINIMDYLYQKGFSVPAIYKNTLGNLSTQIQLDETIGIGVLFEYIEGFDVEFSDIKNDIAQTTAKMHSIMKDYPDTLTVLGHEFYIGRMMKIFRKYYKANSKIRELDEFGSFVFKKIKDLPKSFSHGDYGTHNIIKKEDTHYVIDFDTASGTYPMFDITLICDATDFWKFDSNALQITKSNIEIFIENYTKHCPLTQDEIDSYIYFLALRQYEVRATVALSAIKDVGSDFLNEGYLNTFDNWMVKFTEYMKI